MGSLQACEIPEGGVWDPSLAGGRGPVSDMAVASGPPSCHTARGFSRRSGPPVHVKRNKSHTQQHDKNNTTNKQPHERTPPPHTQQRSEVARSRCVPPHTVHVKRSSSEKCPVRISGSSLEFHRIETTKLLVETRSGT